MTDAAKVAQPAVYGNGLVVTGIDKRLEEIKALRKEVYELRRALLGLLADPAQSVEQRIDAHGAGEPVGRPFAGRP